MKQRLAGLGRGLVVTLFLVQALGVMFFAFGTWIGMTLGEFDGPPVPEYAKLLLLVATLVAVFALIGAALIASGLFDQGFVIPRLLVIGTALVVNIYGVVDQSQWFIDFARHSDYYRSVGFESSELYWTATVVLACATGSGSLLGLGRRAIRSRPKSALLVDA